MRVLVCGSRTWTDSNMVSEVLQGVYIEWEVGYSTLYLGEFVVIEGGAKGADACAAWWADHSPLHSHNERPDDPKFVHEVFAADWEYCKPECRPGHRKYRKNGRSYCPAAGVYRNQRMLDSGVDLVLAFSERPLTSGTSDMITRAAMELGRDKVRVMGHA